MSPQHPRNPRRPRRPRNPHRHLSHRAFDAPAALRRWALSTLMLALMLALMPPLAAAPAMADDGAESAGERWTIVDRDNDQLPGRRIDIKEDERVIASFIHGEGQMKAYLAVYDDEGNLLTNPGLNPDGSTRGRFPHHRGIYVGWNHLHSDLGRDDLWHLRRGEAIVLHQIVEKRGGEDSATLVVDLHWLSANRDDDLAGLLLVERRTITVSRPDGRTRIDHHSKLTASRDIRLEGDLHHAGVQFRADAEVDNHRRRTVYLWEPADLPPGGGRVVSDELRWVNFRFPLHENWYSVTQINPPANKVQELSWRDYGRFGFFFTERLDRGETLEMVYRFLIDRTDSPAAEAEARAEQDAAIRRKADADHEAFAREHPEQ